MVFMQADARLDITFLGECAMETSNAIAMFRCSGQISEASSCGRFREEHGRPAGKLVKSISAARCPVAMMRTWMLRITQSRRQLASLTAIQGALRLRMSAGGRVLNTSVAVARAGGHRHGC